MFLGNSKKGAFLFPLLLVGTGLMVTKPLYARDVIDTANRFSQILTKFGMAISVAGVVICGLYFTFGRQDAGTKLTQCLIGMCCIWGVQTLVSTVNAIA